MNKHLQMFLGHESGSFTLAYVVFTQSSTWRTPGKSEPDCSHTWPALRAWQLKGPYRARLFTTLSKYKPASLSGMEVAAGSVVCCPNHTARGRGNPGHPQSSRTVLGTSCTPSLRSERAVLALSTSGDTGVQELCISETRGINIQGNV